MRAGHGLHQRRLQMGVSVAYQPEWLDFGGVPPNAAGPDISTFGGDVPSDHGGIWIGDPPVGASVVASVKDDSRHFALRDLFVLD
jgi:hypothetical protein